MVNSAANTFLVGAPKAATTALAAALSKHPEAFVCSPKEPHHFSEVPSLGPTAVVTDPSEYHSLFEGVNARVRCDASTTYLYFEAAREGIYAHTKGEAKIVISLRDPVDRAHSHYIMDRFKICTETRDVRSALLNPSHHGKHGFHGLAVNPYIYPSLYADHVRKYREMFGDDNVHVLFFEDLTVNADATLESLFSFLGIDPRETIRLRSENHAVRSRSPLVTKTLNLLPAWGRLAIPSSVKRRVRSKMYKKIERYEIDDDIRAEMNRRFFRSDVEALREILGVSPPWVV